MNKKTITFDIDLDESNLPENITWQASDNTNQESQPCKSIMISIWDHLNNDTLRIDLWTKDMKVDDMDKHFFQTLLTLSETYQKATGNQITEEMNAFCQQLVQKINAQEKEKNEL